MKYFAITIKRLLEVKSGDMMAGKFRARKNGVKVGHKG
jgi:hypothetical protein